GEPSTSIASTVPVVTSSASPPACDNLLAPKSIARSDYLANRVPYLLECRRPNRDALQPQPSISLGTHPNPEKEHYSPTLHCEWKIVELCKVPGVDCSNSKLPVLRERFSIEGTQNLTGGRFTHECVWTRA